MTSMNSKKELLQLNVVYYFDKICWKHINPERRGKNTIIIVSIRDYNNINIILT